MISQGSAAHTGAHGSARGQFMRRTVVLAGLSLLTACAVVPKPTVQAPAQKPAETAPQANVLPSDTDRHRIALLVPMWRGRREVLPWFAAAIVALAVHWAAPGSYWHIAAAAVAGSLAGAIRDRLSP